jgi:hypothetical protein
MDHSRAEASPGTEEPGTSDDARLADSLTRLLRAKMARDYGVGPGARPMLRDAHPKLHGLVDAEFTVHADLPAELRTGVLEPGRRYAALVRFSNQNARVSRDDRGDIRGAAIKLLDVDPPVLDRDEAGPATQDFVLISVDRFVTANAAQFDGLLKALVGSLPRKIWFFLRHPRALRNLLTSLRRHDNPLGVRYFSVVPYRLGDHIVKYALTPTTPSLAPARRGPHHLRETMAAQLTDGHATFDFAVQPRTEPDRMPIEDAGVTWSEARAPFRAVATLRIPAQRFDTAERRALAERLAFNPWHARPEHEPLGAINRARRVVYRALADFRRKQHRDPPAQPDAPTA